MISCGPTRHRQTPQQAINEQKRTKMNKPYKIKSVRLEVGGEERVMVLCRKDLCRRCLKRERGC